MEKTPQEILDGAIDRLKTKGWRTGGLTSRTGETCALGALRVSAFNDVYAWVTPESVVLNEAVAENGEAYTSVLHTLRSLIPNLTKAGDDIGDEYYLTSWNDSGYPSVDKVIQLFEEAKNVVEL